jgi:hypothetical protein
MRAARNVNPQPAAGRQLNQGPGKALSHKTQVLWLPLRYRMTALGLLSDLAWTIDRCPTGPIAGVGEPAISVRSSFGKPHRCRRIWRHPWKRAAQGIDMPDLLRDHSVSDCEQCRRHCQTERKSPHRIHDHGRLSSRCRRRQLHRGHSRRVRSRALDITGDQFHPEWNYIIRPRITGATMRRCWLAQPAHIKSNLVF